MIKQMKFKVFVLLIASLLLQACGSEPVKGNPQKALDDYVRLGLGYLSNGNRKQARQNLLRALRIDPNSLIANDAVALLYQSEGELALAEQHYKLALRKDKNFTQSRNNYARFLYFQGRMKEARDQYKLATEDVNYRLRPQTFIGLALSEKGLGNTDAAEAALLRAIALNHRAGNALLELVVLKIEQQDYVTAKGYLDRFENLGQPTPKSLMLGLDLAEKFGSQEQRETYSMALQNMFPDSREARELILSKQSGEVE